MDDAALKILIERAKRAVKNDMDPLWQVVHAAEKLLSGDSEVPLSREKIEADLSQFEEHQQQEPQITPNLNKETPAEMMLRRGIMRKIVS